MHVILTLQFRKGFFEVPNQTYFVSALIHETSEAFKYGYLSKINNTAGQQRMKQRNLVSQKNVFKNLTS